MQIIGDELIKYDELNFATNEAEISNNSLFYFNRDFIKIAKQKSFEFSVICDNANEAIISNAAGAKLIICDKKNALKFSELANFYMFDTKIACIIDDENELESLSELKVDVAIYKNGVKNGTF